MALTQIDYPQCLINLSDSPTNLSLQPSNITISHNSGNNIVSISPTSAAINTRGSLFSDQLNFGNVSSKLISYNSKGIHSVNGQVFDLTTDNGMTLQNVSSSLGQVITADSAGKPTWANAPPSTWVGTATSPLNMGSYSIDASANNLSLGTLTSTGTTLGKASTTTNIQGDLQIAGQPGTNGQILKSNGTTSVWGDNWTGTASSNLNMATNLITGTSTIGITKPLLPSYPYNLTTGTTPSAIGYILSTITPSPTLGASAISGSEFAVFNGLAITAGVWVIHYSVRLKTNSATNTTIDLYSFWGNSFFYQGQCGLATNNESTVMNNGLKSLFGTGSYIVSSVAGETINIRCYFTGTKTGTISFYLNSNIITATRIA